jgi:hypothetical protein
VAGRTWQDEGLTQREGLEEREHLTGKGRFRAVGAARKDTRSRGEISRTTFTPPYTFDLHRILDTLSHPLSPSVCVREWLGKQNRERREREEGEGRIETEGGWAEHKAKGGGLVGRLGLVGTRSQARDRRLGLRTPLR